MTGSPMPFGVRLVCHESAGMIFNRSRWLSPMPFGVRLVCHLPSRVLGDDIQQVVTNAFRREAGLSPLNGLDKQAADELLSPMPFGVRLVCHVFNRAHWFVTFSSPMPFGVRLVCHEPVICKDHFPSIVSPMPFGVRLVCHRQGRRRSSGPSLVTNAFRREAGLSPST